MQVHWYFRAIVTVFVLSENGGMFLLKSFLVFWACGTLVYIVGSTLWNSAVDSALKSRGVTFSRKPRAK
jgi:hypothetical protein